MKKEDYIAIADAIAEPNACDPTPEKEEILLEVGYNIAQLSILDNPKFNRDKFMIYLEGKLWSYVSE